MGTLWGRIYMCEKKKESSLGIDYKGMGKGPNVISLVNQSIYDYMRVCVHEHR